MSVSTGEPGGRRAGNGQSTVLAALTASLRERARSLDGQERPAAILWADPLGAWRPLLPTLRREMPELLSLCEYAPDDRSGPAIWLRTVIDSVNDIGSTTGLGLDVAEDGVTRQDLQDALGDVAVLPLSRGQCRADLDFDPETVPDVVAGEMLGRGKSA